MQLLRSIWETWKRIGRIIGDFIGRIVLTIFYFTIFAPFGLGVRLLSDPLRLKPEGNPTQWLTRKTWDRTVEDAQKQF